MNNDLVKAQHEYRSRFLASEYRKANATTAPRMVAAAVAIAVSTYVLLVVLALTADPGGFGDEQGPVLADPAVQVDEGQ